MVPILFMTLVMARRLLLLKKHDEVLYRFCEQRRRAMAILRRDNSNMTGNDYTSLRDLVCLLNTAIHKYNEHKRVIFNLRKFRAYFQDFRNSLNEMQSIRPTPNPEVVELYDLFNKSLVQAFCAYTPFLRSELVLVFMIYILRTLAKISGARVKAWLDSACWLKSVCDAHG
jgi:hypothetical protein